MIAVRKARNSDWKAIGTLADDAVAHVVGAGKQSEWLRNRIAFAGERYHYIAQEGRRIVGYAAMERALFVGKDEERIFLVLSWKNSNGHAVADALLERLSQDFATLNVRRIWLREYADDTPFIEYLLSRGFEKGKEYTREGRRLVNLSRTENIENKRIPRAMR